MTTSSDNGDGRVLGLLCVEWSGGLLIVWLSSVKMLQQRNPSVS